MTPAVSVVIATYNYGRFLAGALESVLGQTFPDFEVLVVDDGSTDDTPAVVRPFLRDARVRYYRLPHQKQPRTKNAGIHLARAPLVAFLDADDRWLPSKLEKQVALFRRDPGLGVAYTRRRLIDADGWELEYEQPTLYRGHVLAEMFRTNFVCFSSAVLRRSLLEETGLFDEALELAIDYDLWLRAARRARFDYVDEPIVLYRVGHANLSRRHEERLDAAMRIMRRFLDEHGGRALLPPAVVARAWAETYTSVGRARHGRSALAALPWYARAVAIRPGHLPAWRGLAGLPVPPAWRPRLRRLFGLPARTTPRRLGEPPGLSRRDQPAGPPRLEPAG
jgi:glycosyltransferase involved in cell wall biosynthesis